MRRQIPCATCSESGLQIPSKYKCPACTIASCSLSCVKKHKATTKCTGIRNRAAAVKKANYDDSTFMSDYTLLEDTARQLRAATRTRALVGDDVPGGSGPCSTNKGHMTLLAREAAARNTDLRFLPGIYSRHRRNSTFARRTPEGDQTRVIYWSLDVYVDVDGVARHVRVKSFAETSCMRDLIRSVIDTLRGCRRAPGGRSSTADLYDAAPDDIALYLRNETVLAAHSDVVHLPSPGIGNENKTNCLERPNNLDHLTKDDIRMKIKCGTNPWYSAVDIRKFLPVCPDTTLRDTLSGRCIVEFPVLHMALKGSVAARKLDQACCGIFEKPEPQAASSEENFSGDDEETEDGEEDINLEENKDSNPRIENNMAKVDKTENSTNSNAADDDATSTKDVPPAKRARTDESEKQRGADTSVVPEDSGAIETVPANDLKSTPTVKIAGNEDAPK